MEFDNLSTLATYFENKAIAAACEDHTAEERTWRAAAQIVREANIRYVDTSAAFLGQDERQNYNEMREQMTPLLELYDAVREELSIDFDSRSHPELRGPYTDVFNVRKRLLGRRVANEKLPEDGE